MKTSLCSRTCSAILLSSVLLNPPALSSATGSSQSLATMFSRRTCMCGGSPRSSDTKKKRYGPISCTVGIDHSPPIPSLLTRFLPHTRLYYDARATVSLWSRPEHLHRDVEGRLSLEDVISHHRRRSIRIVHGGRHRQRAWDLHHDAGVLRQRTQGWWVLSASNDSELLSRLVSGGSGVDMHV